MRPIESQVCLGTARQLLAVERGLRRGEDEDARSHQAQGSKLSRAHRQVLANTATLCHAHNHSVPLLTHNQTVLA